MNTIDVWKKYEKIQKLKIGKFGYIYKVKNKETGK